MSGGLVGAQVLAGRLHLPLLAVAAAGEGALLLLALLLAGLDRRGFARLGFGGGWRGFDFAAVPLLIFAHYAVSMVVGVAMTLTHRLPQTNRAMLSLGAIAQMPLGQALLLALAIAGLAGICEEVAFRGYLIPRLEAAGSPTWLAVLLSALAFGALHVPGYGVIASLPKVISFAIPLGAYFAWRRSIWPAIVTHFLVDFSGLLLLIGVARLFPHGVPLPPGF